MKKVLMVSYAFPPVGGGGVQRNVKFVKYLREFGWEPIVLTVANPSTPLVDLHLTKDIPTGIKIYKANTCEPQYSSKRKFSTGSNPLKLFVSGALKRIATNVLLPDFQILWWPGLCTKLIKILKTENLDCIFVSGPPFSTFIPVVFLGKIFKIPVIIDYRDEWRYLRSQLENLSNSRLARKLDNYFEKYCLKHCSVFTAASKAYIEDIEERYKIEKPIRGVCITNGFDTDDFADQAKKPMKVQDTVNIVFSGTIWKGTSLRNFLKATEQLLTSRPYLKKKMKVKIFGRIVDSEMADFRTEAIQDIIEIGGYIDHKAIIHEIQNADILLMSIVDTSGADRIILGKTFEYMATGKHILALIPEGETEQLLKYNYGNATIVEPENIKRIAEAVLRIVENIDSINSVVSKDISQFSRKELTEKLSGVFNSTVLL